MKMVLGPTPRASLYFLHTVFFAMALCTPTLRSTSGVTQSPCFSLTWWLDQSMKNFWRPDTDLLMVTSLWKIRSKMTGGPYSTEGWT